MPLRLSLLAAACAGLFAAAPVLAQSASASIQIAQFSYQLIDLDLNDGITPTVSFTEQILSSSFYDDGSGSIVVQQIDSFGDTEMIRPSGRASTTAQASGSVAQASLAAPAGHFQQFFAQNFYGWEFDITPATGILFRSFATLDASHDGGGSYAVANASMAGYLTHYGEHTIELSSFTDSILTDQGPRRYGLSGYLHSGQDSLKGWVGIQSDASAYAISPVPEPSTWAMLLAGVGLLGWRMRTARN